jgi:hypothetical protein
VYEQYDLMEAAGPRLPFLVLVPSGYEDDEGVYISDFMEDGTYEESLWMAQEVTDEARALWQQIIVCCNQCARMMKIQDTPDKAERILEQHRKGLLGLYRELRAELEKGGIKFANDH